MKKKSKRPRRKEKRVTTGFKNGKCISKPKAQGSLEDFIEDEDNGNK